MLVKVLLAHIEKIKIKIEKQEYDVLHPIKYLIDDELRLTLDQLKNALECLAVQVNENPLCEVNHDTVKSLKDFLAYHWQRSRESSPVSLFLHPHSPANILCRDIAYQLSDELNCHVLELLIPTLEAGDLPYLTELHRFVLSDDEKMLIDVNRCLINARNDNHNPQLKHTKLIGKELLPLSSNEQERVIGLFAEGRACYNTIISADKSKLTECERALRASIRHYRAPNVPKYEEKGRQLLISKLYPTKQALLSSLIRHPEYEWPFFISNFHLNDLSHLLLNINYTCIRFEKIFQSRVQRNEFIYIDNKKYRGMVFLFQALFNMYMEKEKNPFHKCLRELNVIIIGELFNSQEDKISELMLCSNVNDDLLPEFNFKFTAITKDFYSDLFLKIKSRKAELIDDLMKHVQNRDDLVEALNILSPNHLVWNKFANLFTKEQLMTYLLDGNKKDDFEDRFSKALENDALYRGDSEYNRALIYWFLHLYQEWRKDQDDYTTKIPFFRWDMGCDKTCKLNASELVAMFLSSFQPIDKYSIFIKERISTIKEGNKKTDQSQLIDIINLKRALTTGKVMLIVNRMKQVMDVDFKPNSNECGRRNMIAI